jgi:hypothetical protein
MERHESLVELTAAARLAAWSSWGRVDADVIAHLLNPAFMGGPAWPNLREAFVTARQDLELLIASDGLSDPFPNPEAGDGNGYGLEVFAVTVDPVAEPARSWLFDIVWQTSQNAAADGGLAGLLDQLGLVSIELYDVAIPPSHAERFVSVDGRVGALLGLAGPPPPARIDGPLSPIRLVNAKLLTLAELDFVVREGEAGRAELAARFTAQGLPLVSSLDRPDCV